MKDKNKTTTQLLEELTKLRKRVTQLETAEIEYKRIEEELYQSRKMLQLVLDNIPQRVFWKDRNFFYLGCNRLFAQDAGLSDPSEIVGKIDFELGWKKLAQLYRDDDKLVMDTDIPKLNFEEPETTPDGGQLWLNTSKVPLHDRAGKVIGILGTYEDITERKRSEKALRESEQRFRILAEATFEGITLTENGVIVDLNDQHGKMHGYERSELIGKSVMDIVAPASRARLTEAMRLGEIGPIEYFDLRKDGTEFPVEVRAGNIKIGSREFVLAAIRDITAQKQAQEALQNERKLLRVLIDNIPDTIYVKDTECRKTVANMTDVRLTCRQSEAEVLGKTDFDFYPAEIAAKFFADDQSVIQTGIPVINREEYLRNEQGQKHCLLTSKFPLRDEKNQIIGLVGIGHDITERKHVEEALSHEKALMDALMNNIPDSIYFKDRQCRLLRINYTMMRSLNMDKESQAIGKTDLDLFGEEFGRKTLTDEQRLMESGEPIIGLIESRPLADGQFNWTSTTKVPLRDTNGQIVGLVGITREINEFMRTQEELQRERNLLRTLIDNLPDLIFYKDAQGRYVLNNLSHLRSLGMERQEDVIGKSTLDYNIPELAKQYMEDEAKIVQTGQPIYNREELAIHKDTGEQRWHLTSKIPLRDIQGKVMGIVGIARDITEHKRAEEEREKLIAELQNALADVKTLSGLVPICSNCKKIRDDKGYWTQVESFIQQHSQARFTHGLCPDCLKKLYPEFVP